MIGHRKAGNAQDHSCIWAWVKSTTPRSSITPIPPGGKGGFDLVLFQSQLQVDCFQEEGGVGNGWMRGEASMVGVSLDDVQFWMEWVSTKPPSFQPHSIRREGVMGHSFASTPFFSFHTRIPSLGWDTSVKRQVSKSKHGGGVWMHMHDLNMSFIDLDSSGSWGNHLARFREHL